MVISPLHPHFFPLKSPHLATRRRPFQSLVPACRVATQALKQWPNSTGSMGSMGPTSMDKRRVAWNLSRCAARFPLGIPGIPGGYPSYLPMDDHDFVKPRPGAQVESSKLWFHLWTMVWWFFRSTEMAQKWWDSPVHWPLVMRGWPYLFMEK